MNNKHGFTLIETIISLSIISIVYVNFLDVSIRINRDNYNIKQAYLSQESATNIANAVSSGNIFNIDAKIKPQAESQLCAQKRCNNQEMLNWFVNIFTSNIKKTKLTACITKNKKHTKVILAWETKEEFIVKNREIKNCINKNNSNGVLVEVKNQ